MVFRIKFISDEVDGFVREIKIDSDATFLDLNQIILDSCSFPDDQMTSFYLCNEDWERGIQITREDMDVSCADEDIYVMGDTRLSEFIEDEDQHLEFIFDPFSERSFFLDVVECLPGEHLSDPAIIRVKGKAPKQLMDFDTDLAPIAAAVTATSAPAGSSFDDDLALEGGFNADEIDLEGFEISDGEHF